LLLPWHVYGKLKIIISIQTSRTAENYILQMPRCLAVRLLQPTVKVDSILCVVVK